MTAMTAPTARRRPLRPLAAATAALAILAGGCASDPHQGYAFNSAYDTGIRTIAVPVFDNHSFNLEIPAELTEAIAKELQRATPWAVTNTDRADTILQGVVTRVELRKLASDPNSGYVQETAVTVAVDFDWIDARTGKTLLRRRGYTGTDTFTPTRGTGERIEVGERSAVQRLAQDIVGEMRRNDW
jgi:hypothetical protein